MLPTRRDFRFRLDGDKVTSWHPSGVHVTQFFNTLSLFFPEGERFFINAVRHYRDRISDPALKAEVTGFIGQEAMHGREHDDYNDLLERAGLPIKRLEAQVTRLLEFGKKLYSPRHQLGITIALEHFTAILAHGLLDDPRILEGADPRFKALWRWHALEETEHKAVAFDVWRSVVGETRAAYFLRTATMLEATALFLFMLSKDYVAVIRSDAQARGLRGYFTLLNFLFGNPGGLRKIIPAWFDYFRPGFHPWQHDNRRFLAEIPALEQQMTGEPLALAA